MKIRVLEFLRWQKSAQAAEKKGQRLRLLARGAANWGWNGWVHRDPSACKVLLATIFGGEHESL